MTTPRALPPELTIYGLAALRQDLLARLPKAAKGKRTGTREPTPWPLGASGVNEVDAAGLQLLVALAHGLEARQRRLVLNDPSTVLARACERLGLAALLLGTEHAGAGA